MCRPCTVFLGSLKAVVAPASPIFTLFSYLSSSSTPYVGLHSFEVDVGAVRGGDGTLTVQGSGSNYTAGVVNKEVARAAGAGEGTLGVPTVVFTPTTVVATLVYISAGESVGTQGVARAAGTGVSCWCVDTLLLAPVSSHLTLVDVLTRLAVVLKTVSRMTGASCRSCGGVVVTQVSAASVVGQASVDHLHQHHRLITRPAIWCQLVTGVTEALVGSLDVVALVTADARSLALVLVDAGGVVVV